MPTIQPIPARSASDAAVRNRRQTVKLDVLIAKINKLCFHRCPVTFTFKRAGCAGTVRHLAVPAPCVDNCLTAEWLDPPPDAASLSTCQLHTLQIDDGVRLTVSKPRLDHLDNTGIRVILPDEGRASDLREQVRFPCRDAATVCLEGHDAVRSGTLLDFHAGAFRAVIDGPPPPPPAEVMTNGCWRTTLATADDTLFCGMCRILRCEPHARGAAVVLCPAHDNIPVQPPKRHRCERVRPVPAPHIRFRHPLTGRTIILDVVEISGSGFSVNEDACQAVLLPGMRIPRLTLNISQLYRVVCSAAVVNRRIPADADARRPSAVCGLAFTDMAMDDHARLVAYLHQAKDQRLLICHPPDMHALWDFFFDTGFIYPHKYRHIHRQQSAIRETLEKIYLQRPRTSRHFIFQDKGVIKGLIALQRVYRQTWMMHHLAARKEAVIAGPKVLSLVGSYINDAYCLPCNRMKYAIVYYRQENRFPHLVFGGVARAVKNPQICSLDTFAYFHVTPAAPPMPGDGAFDLRPASDEDLAILERVYRRLSGGLMLAAFDLLPAAHDDADLTAAYRSDGLKRERRLYSLVRAGRPVAVMMVVATDIGINLSDLTNCIHVFALQPRHIRSTALLAALSRLVREHYKGAAAINLYPAAAAERLRVDVEKRYTLWTYEMKYSDFYYDHLKKLSRLLSIREPSRP